MQNSIWLARTPHLDPAETPEGRGNTGETADPLFTRRVRQDAVT
jgi:hypothetical protein